MDGLEGQQIDEENGSAAGSNDNFEGVQPHQQPANAAAPPPVVAPLPPPLQDHAIERPTAPRVAARSPTSSVRVVVNPNQNQQALLRQQAHSPTQGGGGTSANSSSSYRSIRGGGFAGARVDSTNSFQNYVVAGPERDNIDESMSFDSPASSGWTVVELSQDGGVPPSARSLHAAALLNGNLLVFGG